MADFAIYSEALLSRTEAGEPFDSYGEEWIAKVIDSALWEAGSPEGLRVPWRLGKLARSVPNLESQFDLPGLYMFGGVDGNSPQHQAFPLYVGCTVKQSLWKRLSSRYIGMGQSTQCQRAVAFQDTGLVLGRCSAVRRNGAIRFARAGIEGIWFTILPVRPEKIGLIKPFEPALIQFSNGWNAKNGFEPLLNRQHSRG